MEDEERVHSHSSTLFLTEEGASIVFYMTPCAMKSQLRPMIEHGGGKLSSKLLQDSIKLAVPGSEGDFNGYISTDYIFDSVENNRLQDLEKYRVKSSGPLTNNKTECQIGSRTRTLMIPQNKRNGRQPYTFEEDLALDDFVKENSHFAIKGNALYKKAEEEKVTSHSWQSMRDHYLKHLHKKKESRQRRTKVKRLEFETRCDVIADQASGKDVSCDEVNQENHDEVNHENHDEVNHDEVNQENDDYDKMFDDTLLRLARESSKTISCNGATDPKEKTSSSENEVTSSQGSVVGVKRRRQRRRILDDEESVSEFDGEISLRKDETSLENKRIQMFSNDSPYHSDRTNDNRDENILLGIKKLCRIEELRAQYSLTVPQVIHSLVINSGHLNNTENYLKHGVAKDMWTLEEDKILLSKDEDALKALEEKRGRQAMLNRIKYMEGVALSSH